MMVYVIRRIVLMVPLLFFITAFVFFLGQYGAPDLAMELTLRINDNTFDPELYESLRTELGLDKPVIVQYFNFIGDALRGDFGVSYVLPGTPDITRLIAATLPISMQLALVALLFLLFIGIPMGVIAAVKRNGILDHTIIIGSTILSSFPAYALAPIVLVVLVSKLGIIPTTGFGWHGMFSRETLLPAAILAAGPLLGIVRFTRASVIDVRSQEYVRAARARGLHEIVVVGRHIVKNSMTPVLTTMGITLGFLLSGSIFVESVFGIKGFGYVAVTAFQSGDVKTVAATTLVGAIIVMFMSLFVDLLYGVLDPRVRLKK